MRFYLRIGLGIHDLLGLQDNNRQLLLPFLVLPCIRAVNLIHKSEQETVVSTETSKWEMRTKTQLILPEDLLDYRASHGLVPVTVPCSSHALVRPRPRPWHLLLLLQRGRRSQFFFCYWFLNWQVGGGFWVFFWQGKRGFFYLVFRGRYGQCIGELDYMLGVGRGLSCFHSLCHPLPTIIALFIERE